MSEEVTVESATEPTIETIVEKYVALRDKKAEIKKAYTAKVEAIDQAMDQLEAFIAAKLAELGVESMRTTAGTAYKTTRTSATVADWPMVLDWVRQNEQWDALEKRVNKTYVEAYRTENDDLPPGVNWTEEAVVQIRRT